MFHEERQNDINQSLHVNILKIHLPSSVIRSLFLNLVMVKSIYIPQFLKNHLTLKDKSTTMYPVMTWYISALVKIEIKKYMVLFPGMKIIS